jgi:hypothetical protein
MMIFIPGDRIEELSVGFQAAKRGFPKASSAVRVAACVGTSIKNPSGVAAGFGHNAVKASPEDVPPPGAGLTTVIVAAVGVAIALAGMLAFNDVEFTKVVA